MTLRLDKIIYAIAAALDIVESQFVGATTNHGKRIAVLCAAMARHLGLSDKEISAIATCALFHDSALTEAPDMPRHCELGQRNIELLSLTNIDGVVLYHHEHADGGGIFNKKEGEYPLGAELIAIADMLDVENNLQRLRGIDTFLSKARRDNRFTKRAAYALTAVLDADLLEQLRDDNIFATAERLIPAWNVNADDEVFINLAELAARIIDYKSEFTRKHTSQIANRAWVMGEFYGYSRDEKASLYLAAALHDIGKLATPTAILEKPGKLTDEEFSIIKDHVTNTQAMLYGISGLENIRAWAGNHHEKLDGTGYPKGLTGAELDFNSRMLACIDIYQAVSEPRPYHGQRSHEETMPILFNMSERGFIDDAIVRDLDKIMKQYSLQDVPKPINNY